MNGCVVETVKLENRPVLKKHNALIHCEGKLTLMQRKLCNILLYNAFPSLKNNDEFTMSLRALCNLVGFKSNDRQFVKVALRALVTTAIEWNLLDDKVEAGPKKRMTKESSWNISSYLAGARIEDGIVSYSYSPQMKSILSTLTVFSPINLLIQTLFNSSYTLSLYENCMRYKKIGQTAWITLELFRKLMGVEESSYLQYKELKRNVIDVAVKEINNKSDIYVEPNFRRIGRKVTAIQFKISVSDRKFENKLVNETINISSSEAKDNNELAIAKCIDHNSLEKSLVVEFKYTVSEAMKILKEYPTSYIEEKIALMKQEKFIEKPKAWLRAALKHDYKSRGSKQIAKAPVVMTFEKAMGENTNYHGLAQYKLYKLGVYLESLEKQDKGLQDEIMYNFEKSLNTIYRNTYKKLKFCSASVASAFISFVTEQYGLIVDDHLSLSEFLEKTKSEYENEYNVSKAGVF